MVQRLGERDTRQQARASERDSRVRVDQVEWTALADLLHRPGHMIQIIEHGRGPLRRWVQAVESGLAHRIAGRKQLDLMTTSDESVREFGYDQFGAPVKSWWNGQKRCGDQRDPHLPVQCRCEGFASTIEAAVIISAAAVPVRPSAHVLRSVGTACQRSLGVESSGPDRVRRRTCDDAGSCPLCVARPWSTRFGALAIRGVVPLTFTGEVQKYRMREMAITEVRPDQPAAVTTA